LPEFAAWRRQIFVRVAALILYLLYLLLLKNLRIFLIRVAATHIKLYPWSYFTKAKIPQDYSSCAEHQPPLAGCCKQGAIRALASQTIAVRA
jgi:hypothetical protein